jgi:hypothetical protein
MSQSEHSSIKRLATCVITLFVLFVAINLAFDETLCVIPPCLSKHRAFESVQIGTDGDVARKILWRAGAVCASEAMFQCPTLMFSDFWRTYSVSFDTHTGIVVEKKFTFRIHGKGLLGRLHIWKS